MLAEAQVNPETAEWLDGPRVTSWLRENGLESLRQFESETLERAYGRWREGARASLYVLDQMLVKLHLHLSDIPDDLWVAPPPCGPRPLQIRDEVVQLIRRGLGVNAIARQIGCNPKTVRYHRAKAGLV